MTLLLAPRMDADGLLTRRAALDGGLDDRQLRRLVRRGELVRLRRGVYVDASHWDSLDPYRGQPLLRVRAARCVLMSDQYAFSHDSSSMAHGLGAPAPRRALVHVTHPKVHGDADRAGIKHHLAPYVDSDLEIVDGLPVLGLARTALDMAREHGLVAGVACLDAALGRGVTRSELAATRKRMHCWPHSRVMDAALDLADPGSESWLESEGRLLVLGLNIGRPRTQVGLTDGDRIAWCDLMVGRHVFEVDGLGKYQMGSPPDADPMATLRREKTRQDFLCGLKLGVSRITAHDCHAGREQAERRLLREYNDTCARFGTDLSDLTPHLVQGPRRR